VVSVAITLTLLMTVPTAVGLKVTLIVVVALAFRLPRFHVAVLPETEANGVELTYVKLGGIVSVTTVLTASDIVSRLGWCARFTFIMFSMHWGGVTARDRDEIITR
jgi:hypothetical protein